MQNVSEDINTQSVFTFIDLTDVKIAYDLTHNERNPSSLDLMKNDLISRGATIEYISTGPITEELLSNYDIMWLDEDWYETKPWTADEQAAVQSWISKGGGLIVHGDEPGAAKVLTSMFGINYTGIYGTSGYTTNIEPHYITQNVSTVYASSPVDSLMTTAPGYTIVYDPGNDPTIACSEYGAGRIVVMGDDYLWDTTLVVADNRVLANQAFDWLAIGGGIDWLSEYPTEGNVTPGNYTNITVTFNATELEEGEYNATIIIESNDPDESPQSIPVNLTVIPPEHDIAVTNLSAPEEVEANAMIAVNGTVCNLGLNNETDVVVDFIVDGIIEDSTTILSLTSGNCTNVSFNWTAPGVEGEHNLTIYAEPVTNETIVWNNMLSQNISVITIADIWVMPEEFNVTLQRGDVTEENLTIGNNGTGVLEFNIIDLPGTFGTLTGGRHTVIRKPIHENAIPLWWSDLPVKRRDTNHIYPPSKLKDAIASRTTNITPASKNVPVYTKKIDEEVSHVDFRVETYTPTTLDEYGIMWLDTDQNPETGATEEWWSEVGLNDIGADYMVEMDVGWNEAYLYEWNADAERFERIGWLTLIPGKYDFRFSIPLALIEDDGNMNVTLVMGNYIEPLDIAPNTGHGTIEATEPMTTIITDPEEGVDVDIKQVDAGTISMSPIIFDPEEGFDIDIKQVDAGLDTDVYFRVETYTPTTLDEYGIMWLDTDQNPGTGATEEWWPGAGLNDIGADYAVIIWPEDEEVELYEWNPWLKDFELIGWYSLILGEYDLTFSIPLAHIKDDGNMDVTLVMGTYYAELLDIAPDVGHGTVGGVDWLSEYPTSGTVDPGNATNITVTINTTELEVGTYNATIIIANNDPDENPVFVPVNLTVINLPHIISFSPTDLAPTQYINTTNTFSVTTDQVMTSNTWFVSPIVATTTGNGTSSLTVTWDSTGVYNVTYVGSNENGDVNITWTVTVIGEGGVATAVRPKVSSVTPTGGTAPLGTVVNLSVVIVNSENFDDVFRVNLTTEDIPPEYKASLDWFNWTFKEVGIPAKGEATIPLQADIPADASGVRAFKVAVESTKWTSKTFDTGIFVIT